MQSAYAFPTERPPTRTPASASSGLRYSGGDIIALLWRERLLMLAVLIVVALLGVAAASRLKTVYPAHSSLLVRLSSEYVYNPRVGDAARGAVPEIGQVMQSEIEILSSPVIKARVIHDIGLARLFPKLGAAYVHADAVQQTKIEGAAIKAMENGLKITSAPDTSVVRVTYAHPDPLMAALVLNTLIDEYLKYRTTVLSAHDAGVIGDERRAFQARLDDVNAAYVKFLADNKIGDFDTEKASQGALYSQLLTDSYSVQAQLSEADGRLGVTEQEVSQSKPEIGLYRDVDHVASDKLITLRLDRQDLLSRYKPDAQPVKDEDRKIAELEAISASGQASGPGARRVGINPVYQTLQTEQNQLRAEAASLRSRKAVLAAELAQVSARRQRLAELEPEYQNLVQQRDILSTNVRNFTTREQESQAQQAIAQQGDSNVRVVERAFVPTIGSSLKLPLMILAVVFALFTALCIGLLRGFTRRGYPTAAAAQRSLDLPVLATAPFKPAQA
jgi:uncharacterized protein involved in exopolysaccharide biosynthesis